MPAQERIQLDLQALIYREDAFWIAHCLEMDIAAEGATPMEAIQSLVDVTNVQITAAIEEGDLASLFSPAPSELWRLFWLAKERPVRSLPRKSVKPVNRLRFREWATA